jgi:hypothetical protein
MLPLFFACLKIIILPSAGKLQAKNLYFRAHFFSGTVSNRLFGYKKIPYLYDLEN